MRFEVLLGCRKVDEEIQVQETVEQCGVFLEEDLVSTMLHKNQGDSSPLIGVFGFSLILEASILCCSKVGWGESV